MTTPPETDITPTRLEEDLVELDKVFTEAKQLRKRVIDKLATTVDSIQFDFKEARQTEVQMQLVNGLLGALKDDEAAIGRRVGTKLKKIDTESGSKHSAAVAELLARAGASGKLSLGQSNPVQSQAEIDHALEQAFLAHALEPVADAELKTDPNDVSL